MQDRYVGDIGDFGKYGLLRQLVGRFDDLPSLALGVIWYKVPDESHNNDGTKIHYLTPSNRNARTFEACDPELYGKLRALVTNGRRSLRDVERNGILPTGTKFYSDALAFRDSPNTRPGRIAHRDGWVAYALRVTVGCDVVFVDPDNGLQCASVEPHARLGPKYACYEELLPIIDRGQTLIAYHHTARYAPVETQVRDRIRAFKHLRSQISVTAVRFRRGSSRTFLIVPASAHRQVIGRRIDALLATPWRQHFELITH